MLARSEDGSGVRREARREAMLTFCPETLGHDVNSQQGCWKGVTVQPGALLSSSASRQLGHSGGSQTGEERRSSTQVAAS